VGPLLIVTEVSREASTQKPFCVETSHSTQGPSNLNQTSIFEEGDNFCGCDLAREQRVVHARLTPKSINALFLHALSNSGRFPVQSPWAKKVFKAHRLVYH